MQRVWPIRGAGSGFDASSRVASNHRGVDSRPVLWILVIVLSILGGAAAIGKATRDRKKLVSAGGMRQLEGERRASERTLTEVRVGDIVTMDNVDYVCEGTIAYDEDGQRWIAARCVDNQRVNWVVVGIDRAASSSIRVLVEDNDAYVAGYPPEQLVVGDTTYRLDKRGTATCVLTGDVGGLAPLMKGRPAGHVERCRWWLYMAPGDSTLLVEQWGADFRALRGHKVAPDALELMQAS